MMTATTSRSGIIWIMLLMASALAMTLSPVVGTRFVLMTGTPTPTTTTMQTTKRQFTFATANYLCSDYTADVLLDVNRVCHFLTSLSAYLLVVVVKYRMIATMNPTMIITIAT